MITEESPEKCKVLLALKKRKEITSKEIWVASRRRERQKNRSIPQSLHKLNTALPMP